MYVYLVIDETVFNYSVKKKIRIFIFLYIKTRKSFVVIFTYR